jgi:hypothetical protein
MKTKRHHPCLPALESRNALAILIMALPIWSWGQSGLESGKKPLLDFKGQMGWYTDLYLAGNSTRNDSVGGRPLLMSRWNLDAKLGVWKFNIPIKVTLGLPGGGFGQIRIPDLNLKQYLLMPGNRLGIQPTYKSFRLFLGAHTAKVSPLTAGNVPFVTGIGAHWNPWGVLQLKASYGITQQKVERDTAQGVLGGYQRKMFAAQIGVGKEKENHFYLSYVRAMDDTTQGSASDHTRPVRTPVDGAVVAMDIGVKLGRRMYFKWETAVSAFSVNLADSLSSQFFNADVRHWLDKTAKILPLNNSTRIGMAADAKVAYKGRNWDGGIKGMAYSPGYQSLAFLNLQDDRAELSAYGNARMFKNRLTLQGAGFTRFTNLLQMQRRSTLQLQLHGNATLMLFQRLVLTASYLEFGMQAYPTSKSSVEQMQTRNLGFSPSMAFGKTYVQNVALHIGLDELQARTTLDALSRNQAVSVGVSHSLTLPSSLGVQVSLNRYQNSGDTTDLQMWNASLGVQESYWKERLQVSAQLQSFYSTDNQKLQFRLNGSIKLKISGQFNSNMNIMVLPPNDKGPGCLIRHSLTYTF